MRPVTELLEKVQIVAETWFVRSATRTHGAMHKKYNAEMQRQKVRRRINQPSPHWDLNSMIHIRPVFVVSIV
jgi:hypothetical protein